MSVAATVLMINDADSIHSMRTFIQHGAGIFQLLYVFPPLLDMGVIRRILYAFHIICVMVRVDDGGNYIGKL